MSSLPGAELMRVDLLPLPLLRSACVLLLAGALGLAVRSCLGSWCRRRVPRESGGGPLQRRGVVLVMLASLSAFVLVAVRERDAHVRLSELAQEEIDPAPALPTRCALPSYEARAHATALEQVATARWERVPFAPEEAPRALSQMAEAELCYGALDRGARMRTRGRKRAYAAELTRRFQRARLLLRVALREGRLEAARQQIAVQLALLSRAAAARSQHYRARLAQLDRAYEAELIERGAGATSQRGDESAQSQARMPGQLSDRRNMHEGGDP